jgi:REP element-mobilizing transposase RayT
LFHTWFITWRTYGTWLPGDEGFVGYYRAPNRTIRNEYDSPTAAANPNLKAYSRELMKGQPVELSHPHAESIFSQLKETVQHKQWKLHAVAIISTHVHVVLSVMGNPEGSDVLKVLKNYASRRLNAEHQLMSAPRWFADRGSTRIVKGDLREVINYVRHQANPLIVWVDDEHANHPATDVADRLVNRQCELPGRPPSD